MTKLVYLVEQLINSGPENVVLNICKSIDREVYEPVIFSLRDEAKEKSIEGLFKALDIDIVHFGCSTLQEELQTGRLASIIHHRLKEVGGDILHAHCYHPQLIAQHIKDIPTVVTLHNISGEDLVMKKGRVLGNYMRFRFDRALPRFTCAVAISDYMMDYYQGKCKHLTKIPNGVSFQRNESFDAVAFKTSLGIETEKKVVLVAGSLSERKNVGFLLREVKRSERDFICLILGDGERMEECKVIAGTDSRFRFEGFQNNVQDYMGIADLYVSASRSEGLPMSVLESLNMGVPCLLSAIPPHEEIQRNMGGNGVMCFPLVEGALSEAFEKMMTTCQEPSLIAESASELYSAKAMTRKYEELYEKIIAGTL